MSEVVTYSCHGFNDHLPKGKASGTLAVYQGAIECTIAGRCYRMPLVDLQIKTGGASNRLVFLTHPLLPDWTFYTSDRLILSNVFLRQHQPLKPYLRKAQRTRLLNGALLAVVIIAILALPLILLSQTNNIVKLIARQVPLPLERQLGDAAYTEFIASATIMDEKITSDLLQPMIIHLENALVDNPYDFNFAIVNNAELNAFALPSGYIVIHSGLILEAESAEELLGVLAHEMAHVTEQHGLRNTIASLGTFAIVAALFGDISGISGVIVTAAPLLINQSYSRNFEREADEVGYQLLVDANIDPKGLTLFFEKIIEQEKLAFAGIEDDNTSSAAIDPPVFLRSHPTTEERIKRLQKMAINNKQQQFLDLTAEFNELQIAVKQFVTSNTPEKAHHAIGN